MALNGNQMGSEVAAYVLAQAGAPLNAAERAGVEAFWQGICTVIVAHITTNGHATPGTYLDAESRPLTGLGGLE